jgi:hypothetical protein
MSLVTDTGSSPSPRRFLPRAPGAAPDRTYPVESVVPRMPMASQNRAARRRAARRDEQAVSSWLRELGTRPR